MQDGGGGPPAAVGAAGGARATVADDDGASVRRHLLLLRAAHQAQQQQQQQQQQQLQQQRQVQQQQQQQPPPPPLSAVDQTLLAARARAEAELLARHRGQQAHAQAQAQAEVQAQLLRAEVEARAVQRALLVHRQAQAEAQQAQEEARAEARAQAQQGRQVPGQAQAQGQGQAQEASSLRPVGTAGSMAAAAAAAAVGAGAGAAFPTAAAACADEGIDNKMGDNMDNDMDNDMGDMDDDIRNLPTFTAEDERRELSNLTPEDILQLRRDMLGMTMANMPSTTTTTMSTLATSTTAADPNANATAMLSSNPHPGSMVFPQQAAPQGGFQGAAPLPNHLAAAAAVAVAAGGAGASPSSPPLSSAVATATNGTGTANNGGETMDSLLLRHRRQVRADTDLRNLQRELDALPPEDKGAYLAAVDPASDRPCRAEAEGRDGRGRNRHLAYLEGCNFDARAAARKVAQYWTERLELFGPARAFEPMSLRGAMKDEIDWMIQSSIAQTLPCRDRSGRTIIFGDPSRRDAAVYDTHRQNMAMWYLLETVIEDEESRNRGLVVLTSAKAYATGSGMDLKFSRFTRKAIADVFPVHLRSIHFCHPSKVAHYVIFPALKFVLGKEMRLRFNTHCGTDAEVLLQLETFGLHRSILPAELCGDVQLDFRKWIHQRLLREHAAEAMEVSCLPRGAAAAAPSLSGASDVDGLEALSLAAAVAQPVAEGSEGDTPQKSWRDLKFKRKPKRKHSQTDGGSSADESDTLSSLPSSHINPNRQIPFKLNRQSKKDLIDLEEVLNDTETPKSGKKKVGRRADPRMNRAVRIKLRNPEITPFAALVQGGYDYPTPVKGSSAHEIFDSDNVSLHQRKNQLCRRVRQLREKQKRDEAKAAKAAAK